MVITVGTVFVPSQMTNNLSRWHGHHSRDSICPQSDDKQSIKMAWLFTIESIFLPGPKAKKLPRFHDHHGRVCSPPQYDGKQPMKMAWSSQEHLKKCRPLKMTIIIDENKRALVSLDDKKIN